MKNKVKMTLPYEQMTINEVEKWLEEMAQQGYILQKFRLKKIIFKNEEPRHIKYRIIHLQKDLVYQQREEYMKIGYDRAAIEGERNNPDFTVNFLKYYVFKTEDIQNINEITGDEIDVEFTIQQYKKSKRKKIFSVMGLLASIGLSVIIPIIRMDGYDLHTLHGYLYMLFFMLVNFFVEIIKLLHDKTKKENIVAELPKEIVLEKEKPTGIRTAWIFFVIIVLVFLPGYGGVFDKKVEKNLEHTDKFISILDIEGNNDILQETGSDYEECFLGSSVPTLLIAEHYNYEKAFEYISDSVDANKLYYEIRYYNSLFKVTMDYSYNQWIKNGERYNWSEDDIEYTSSKHFDTVAYCYWNGFPDSLRMCFYNGEEMLDITYSGDKTPEEIIAVVDEIFEK